MSDQIPGVGKLDGDKTGALASDPWATLFGTLDDDREHHDWLEPVKEPRRMEVIA